MDTCLRPAHDWASQYPIMYGKAHKAPPLPGELLLSSGGERIIFFSGVTTGTFPVFQEISPLLLLTILIK